MKNSIFVLITLALTCSFSAQAEDVLKDTYPALCEQLRMQIDEDCSEEPSGRTYEDCFKEDLLQATLDAQEAIENAVRIELDPAIECRPSVD